MKNMLTRRILLPFHSIGSNIRENVQQKLEEKLYNKCSKEGYIKNGSIKILSYSSGLVEANNVLRIEYNGHHSSVEIPPGNYNLNPFNDNNWQNVLKQRLDTVDLTGQGDFGTWNVVYNENSNKLTFSITNLNGIFMFLFDRPQELRLAKMMGFSK